jgi:hypothetical protein
MNGHSPTRRGQRRTRATNHRLQPVVVDVLVPELLVLGDPPATAAFIAALRDAAQRYT